ncbi:MAG: hypothetical protein MHPSP_003513, partial [Paramarteilia canceri]
KHLELRNEQYINIISLKDCINYTEALREIVFNWLLKSSDNFQKNFELLICPSEYFTIKLIEIVNNFKIIGHYDKNSDEFMSWQSIVNIDNESEHSQNEYQH